MSNNIIKRTYFKIECENSLPLSIGGIETEVTDQDALIRLDGTPYIPATTLAGALRASIKQEHRELIFGCSDDFSQSRLFIEDAAVCLGGSNDHRLKLEVRNFVQLENRIAVPGALFNFQYIPPGAGFNLIFELVQHQNDTEDLIETLNDLIVTLKNEGIYLGSKKNRGFGLIKANKAFFKSFDMRDQKSYQAWLDFNYLENEFLAYQVEGTGNSQFKDVLIALRQESPLLVKDTSSFPEISSEQATVNDRVNIPGSSIAGVFRAYLNWFLEKNNSREKQILMDHWMGSKKESETNQGAQSRLIFHDTYMDKKFRRVARNRIDRFTGGTIASALFTELVHMPESDCQVMIRYRFEGIMKEVLLQKAIQSFARDIDLGLVTFGSGASIGRGRFGVLSVKGLDLINGDEFKVKISELEEIVL